MTVEIADLQRELERLCKEIAWLNKSEARHRAILDSQTELICRFTADTTLTYVNEAYCRFFQKPREAIIGVSYLTHIPEEYREEVVLRIGSLSSFREEGRAITSEHAVILPDGSIGWLEWINQAIYDEEGTLVEIQAVGRDITARKRDELERQARRERKRQAFGAGEYGSWEWDIQTDDLHWSDNISPLFGLPFGTLKRTHTAFLDRVHPEDRAMVEEAVDSTLDTGASFQVQYRAVLPDGALRWHEVQGELILEEDGCPRYLSGIVRDISERKVTEEALRESESRLRAIVDITPDVCIQWYDLEGRVLYWNKASEQVFGWTASEALGKTLDQLISTPEQARDFVKALHEVAETGQLCGPVECDFRYRNGETGVCLSTIFEIPAVANKSTFVCMDVDITALKRTEEALRKREEDARHFSEQLKLLHALSIELSRADSLDTLCRLAVEQGRKDLGFDRFAVWLYNEDKTQLLGMYGTDESGVTRCEQGQVWEVRTPWILEFRDNTVPINIRYDVPLRNHRNEETGGRGWHATIALRDGESVIGVLVVDNLLQGMPLQESQCELLGLYGSMLGHLCVRKKTAEALKESQERTAAVIEAAMDAMVTIDEEMRIVVFNHAAEAAFGCKAEDVIGQTIERFLPERIRTRHEALIRHFGQTGERNRSLKGQRDFTAVRADGKEFPIEASISQVEVQGKKLYSIILRDISERLGLEEQLLQSQKMEGIGRLAGGVAHDFNNLLTAIIGYAELAEDSLPADSNIHLYLESIQKAAERATNLSAQLLAFARKQMISPKVVCLNDLTLDIDKLLRRLIGEDIELVTRTAPDLGRVKVDPGQFEQVIVNLCVNARDAMPQGGKLTLETANLYLDGAISSYSTDMSPGEYVMLSVCDTGQGMDEETKKHLFEPFFTTKEVGKGTGLGLATCHGIVKQAGGHIQFESEPGKGTAFRIYLPRVEQSVEAVSLPEATAPTGGTETLLVVEDELIVRDMTITALRAQGYTVLEAETGAAALHRVQEYPGEIDLLITDVVMPLMSGWQLAQQLERIRPGIKVLYLSGYTDEAIVQHNVIDTNVAFLQKPFSPTALAKKVRDTLASPG